MALASCTHVATVDQRARSVRANVGLSAVLPAYNEEAIIATTVGHVAEVVRGLVDDFELIVTDDGSRDRTGTILRSLQQNEALHLRVVTHERNRGYGAALASGFDAAEKELVFMTDGDRQFNVAELGRFLPLVGGGADLVIGWRRHRQDPPIRRLNAWGWKQLVNGLFGYTARDVDCAFKLFRRHVWESMAVRSHGATFSAEFLIKARRLGYRVAEVPVSHLPRTAGAATGARPAVIARAFWELFLLRLSLARQLTEDARNLHTVPAVALSATAGLASGERLHDETSLGQGTEPRRAAEARRPR